MTLPVQAQSSECNLYLCCDEGGLCRRMPVRRMACAVFDLQVELLRGVHLLVCRRVYLYDGAMCVLAFFLCVVASAGSTCVPVCGRTR